MLSFAAVEGGMNWLLFPSETFPSKIFLAFLINNLTASLLTTEANHYLPG